LGKVVGTLQIGDLQLKMYWLVSYHYHMWTSLAISSLIQLPL